AEAHRPPVCRDATIFGARAEPFARYHTKGKQAFIEGSLRLDTWEDKNGGGKRSKLYVVADTWEFVGGGRGEGQGGERSSAGAYSGGYGGAQSGRQAAGNPDAGRGDAGAGDDGGGSNAAGSSLGGERGEQAAEQLSFV